MATEIAPTLEATTAEAPPAVAEAGAKQPHRLERKWTFWFDNQSKPKQQGAAWGSSIRKLYTFETVEEFWWYVCDFIRLWTWKFYTYCDSIVYSFIMIFQCFKLSYISFLLIYLLSVQICSPAYKFVSFFIGVIMEGYNINSCFFCFFFSFLFFAQICIMYIHFLPSAN